MSALFGAKTTADFLLNLSTAQVPLSLVIGERDACLKSKGEHPILVLLKPIKQVTPWGLLWSPALTLLWWRLLLIGLSKNHAIAPPNILFASHDRSWRFMQFQQ
jgi:hypothetical protein